MQRLALKCRYEALVTVLRNETGSDIGTIPLDRPKLFGPNSDGKMMQRGDGTTDGRWINGLGGFRRWSSIAWRHAELRMLWGSISLSIATVRSGVVVWRLEFAWLC
jgi:hypothetical protein